MHENAEVRNIRVKRREAQVGLAKQDLVGFTTLYHSYVTRVYRYIYARVSNHQDAEDLTAQVFEAVLKGYAGLGGDSNYAAWIFTIARNKVVDSYRKLSKDIPLDAAHNFPAETPDPLSLVSKQEDIDHLSVLVNALDEDKQEVIRLRYSAELTYAEIGEVVGKSEAAVKMILHRLLRQLNEEMESKNE